jgi:hypothetical protein
MLEKKELKKIKSFRHLCQKAKQTNKKEQQMKYKVERRD